MLGRPSSRGNEATLESKTPRTSAAVFGAENEPAEVMERTVAARRVVRLWFVFSVGFVGLGIVFFFFTPNVPREVRYIFAIPFFLWSAGQLGSVVSCLRNPAKNLHRLSQFAALYTLIFAILTIVVLPLSLEELLRIGDWTAKEFLFRCLVPLCAVASLLSWRALSRAMPRGLLHD